MDTNYNRKNRRKYSLKAHIVLVTKYRKQLLKGIISEDIKSQMLDISHKYNRLVQLLGTYSHKMASI